MSLICINIGEADQFEIKTVQTRTDVAVKEEENLHKTLTSSL